MLSVQARLIVATPVLALCSCDRAPSISILGSYVPAWLICSAFGLLCVGMVNLLLGRLGFLKYVPFSGVALFAIGVAAGVAMWLLIYAN